MSFLASLAGNTFFIKASNYNSYLKCDSDGTVVSARNPDEGSKFVVELVPEREGMIAFRVDGTNLYLTQNPYGDKARAQFIADLEQASLPLPADVYMHIVEFAVGTESNQENFEGLGFNYAPMKATQGPPGLFQTFSLEGPNPFCVGIKSCFGKYWRNQHWTSQVSQSSHFKGDETWALTIHPNERPWYNMNKHNLEYLNA